MSNSGNGSSRLGLWLAVVFLSLFVLAIAAVTLVPRPPGDSGESGVLLVIFAIPWVFFLDSMNLPSSLPAYEIVHTVVTLVIPVVLNAAAIYLIGNVLGNALRKVGSRAAVIGGLPAEKVDALWKIFNIFFWIIFITYFVPLLQVVIPISGFFLGVYTITSIVHWLGAIILLGYFSYALTLKKNYLLLGLLALISYLNIGLIVGYAILYQIKKRTALNAAKVPA